MELRLMVEGQEGVTWEQWLALAQACEEHGVGALFRSDHYSSIVRPEEGSLDAWTTLAALAAVTDRVRLGTMVSPATFRHPSVLARMAVTVDHVSGGRLEVGMGTGWFEGEHVRNGFPFPDVPTRFALFAEQVEIVVRSWTESAWSHDGRHYALEGQTALPRPVQQPHPPLILGGSAGRRSAALAARYAAEYNTPFASPEQCRGRREALDRACAAIGRDPGTLPLSLMTTCVVGADRAEADERVARVRAVLGDDAADFEPPTDIWLVGTVDEVAERLGAYAEAGVARAYLQHLDHADTSAVETIGRGLAAAL